MQQPIMLANVAHSFIHSFIHSFSYSFIHSFIHSIIYLFVFIYLKIRGPSEPILSEQIPDVRTNIIPTLFLLLHMDRARGIYVIY